MCSGDLASIDSVGCAPRISLHARSISDTSNPFLWRGAHIILTHWSKCVSMTTLYHLSLVINGMDVVIKSFNNFLCELFFGFLVVMDAITKCAIVSMSNTIVSICGRAMPF